MSGGLFKPPKHKWIADIVSFETPAKARASARRLLSILKRGRKGNKRIGRKTALTIVRALVYAANRARASAKRRNLSPKERRELKRIAEIYKKASEKALKIYALKYSKR